MASGQNEADAPLDEAEAPLRVPEGYEIIVMAPEESKLNPTEAASDALLDMVIMVKFEDYGWCKGIIVDKVVDSRRAIRGDRVNFLAKFDIDKGAVTDLSLEAAMYDTSPSADYQSWMLLRATA